MSSSLFYLTWSVMVIFVPFSPPLLSYSTLSYKSIQFFFFFFTLFQGNFIYFIYFLILKSLILTCVPKHEPPSHLPPHNISLGHPHAPAPNIYSFIWPKILLPWQFSGFVGIINHIVYLHRCTNDSRCLNDKLHEFLAVSWKVKEGRRERLEV